MISNFVILTICGVFVLACAAGLIPVPVAEQEGKPEEKEADVKVAGLLISALALVVWAVMATFMTDGKSPRLPQHEETVTQELTME